MKQYITILCASLLAWNPLFSEVDFSKDIEPIFEQKCSKCHNEDKQKGGLNLKSKRSSFSEGDSGLPSLVAGSLEKSELWHRITTDDEDEFMPSKGEPLDKAEVAKVKAWIEQGAKWPESEGQDKIHWAYVPPVKPNLPKVKRQDWVKNEIDHFILAKMEKGKFSPNPPADKGTWLRRVSLDLTGMSPTLKEYRDYMNDSSPNADEKVIDRLLASESFGELWATYWLDMARYADSGGYQADQMRSTWSYRDWVIKALNKNMPYDQFSIEQLAGDLIENATIGQRIATGFHRNTTCNVEAGVDPEANRVNQVVDRVNVTGAVWLGTTLECAQCHSHKYDPFSQKEYYQMLSFFNNTPLEVEGNGVTYNFIGPKMKLPLSREKNLKIENLEKEESFLAEELECRVVEKAEELESWRTQVINYLKEKDQKPFMKFDQKISKAKRVEFEDLPRNQILVSGENPDKNQYTLYADLEEKTHLGLRLEALPHDSLPDGGVGRETDRDLASFAINSFDVYLVRGEKKTKLAIGSAMASYSDGKAGIHLAYDKSSKTAWSVNKRGHEAHSAYFFFKKPLVVKKGDRIKIHILQDEGRQRTMGSFGIAPVFERGPWERLSARDIEVLNLEKKNRNKSESQILRTAFQKNDPELIKLNAKLQKVRNQIKSIQPDTSLVMVEMEEPRETHIMKRGEYTQPGLKVSPGVPSILPAFPEGEQQNRLGFAKWLFRKDNPLVARTAVNRYWLRLMGKGIVMTPEDLGTQSDPPTHPELLDWLAVTFVESGWDIKGIIKKIAMSQTYRQSSELTELKLTEDSNNIYYSYMKRRRLSAESVRDNMLRITGLLNEKMYGPATYPPQPADHWNNLKGRNQVKYIVSNKENRFRRSVYTVWKRSAPYVSYVNFDAPDRSSCVIERPDSNTPIQALTLMNDPIYLEFAKSLALQLMDEEQKHTLDKAFKMGFQRAVTRPIKASEMEFLSKKLSEYESYYRVRPEMSKNLNEGIKAIPTPTEVDSAKLSAWICIANIILNLDEIVMRG